MRVKWPPSVILGSPFSRKGFPQKVFELIGTDELAARFAAILEQSGQLKKAWALITAESRMFVWWNNNEEEKGNWDSKRL